MIRTYAWLAVLGLSCNVLAADAARTAPAEPSGMQTLFTGKDLNGWSRLGRHADSPRDLPPGFIVKNGQLVTNPSVSEDDIWYTREKIGNATLRVVFKVDSERANSGIFIRIPEAPQSEDDAINKGIEVQIDQGDDDWHCTGVLYSMTKAKARPYKPIGEWNTMEIAMRGPRGRIVVTTS